MDILLGVDLGTTNIKCVAYSVSGEAVAQASRPTPTVQQGMRRAYHDPDALWREMAAAISEVASALPTAAQVAGLAIASIGEAGAPLDAHGQPLYPIIAWNDERTAPQSAWWRQTMGEEAIYRHTGLPLGHTFTVNKLMWLRDNEPAIYAQLGRWLCVSDYMAYRLTGEQCMGYSLASRTMALDLARRRWSREMLAHAGVDVALLPELLPEGSLVGRIQAEAARATRLLAGTPVFVGGHDHVCGALAMGACCPGVVLDSTGTTEAELTTLDSVAERLKHPDLSFCLGAHAAQGRYYATGSILGAGSMLRWVAGLLWPTLPDGSDALQALTQAASESAAGARGLYLLPHLAGAGSPDRDSTARGVWVGLSLEHSRADLARAAIEGLAFELRLVWETLERFTGQPIERVNTVGGGARNRLWTQIKADATGRSLYVPTQTEAVTLGAAILAGIGAGLYADENDAQQHLHFEQITPDPQRAAEYERFYRILMDQVRPLASELGRRMGKL